MAEAVVSGRRRISAIWTIPIVAVVLGAWLVVDTYLSRGPEVTIAFATADGIEVGKTKIKLRAVDLGVVEALELREDFTGVTVRARLDPTARPLLRNDTQFWVVRPRIGRGGVSGLGTLLSGAYIELAPGVGGSGRHDFRGLDDPPVSSATAAGLHLTLVGMAPAALSTGDPVLYRDYTVGRVESASFDPATKQARFGVFIEAPYDELVTSTTRFWNASGIGVDLGAEGVSVRTASLEALLMGGVAFGQPADAAAGEAVEAGAEFALFADVRSIDDHPATHHEEYLLLFDTSIRGLEPGAPVEYRGIRVGTVVGASLDYVSDRATLGPGGHVRIPVLVRLDPVRLELGDTETGREELARVIERGVESGLRASLKSGSLLTGRLFVALDFSDDAVPASVREVEGYKVLPTESAGLEQIEHQVTAVLVSARRALDGVTATLSAATTTLDDLDVILAQDTTQGLPGRLDETLRGLAPGSELYEDLHHTLADLSSTLANLDAVATTLSTKPNALLLSSPQGPDPEPKVMRP